MKKMRKLLLFILVSVVISLYGCKSPYDSSAYFFGVDFKNKSAGIETFQVKGMKDGSISYSYNKSYSNLDTFAYGYLSTGSTLSISVRNESSAPIQTNYFLDSFIVVDRTGKTYVLEKPEITAYPSESYINPNQSVRFNFDLSKSGIQLNDYDYVSLIAVNLGGQKTIYLKPIPNREFIATTPAYVAKTVNFRKENNTNSEIIEKLPKGTKVTVIEQDGNWVKVKAGTNVVGFIHESYLDRFKFD